jgi:hypothetical protein
VYQWQMVSESLEDDGMIAEWLSRDFEPFAVTEGRVYLKQHVWTEPADKEVIVAPAEVRSDAAE